MPGEWEAQEALWLSWPCNDNIWPGKLDAVQEKFAAIVAIAARFQTVRINAPVELQPQIMGQLKQHDVDRRRVEMYPHRCDDVWVRDHGPIFLKDKAGTVLLTDWRFNAWGGKFLDFADDNAVPARIASELGLERRIMETGFVLEGGAVESNGAGALLTTSPVLLNPNRNPDYDKGAVEAVLRRGLGVDEIIWLPEVLPDDDTDGHVDNVARFFAEDAVLCVTSLRLPQLSQNVDTLRGRFGTVVELPLPEHAPSPASYANFVLLNGAVLVPVFGERALDQRACGIIGECFPGLEVVPIDCRLLLEEGGALHCMTCNQFA